MNMESRGIFPRHRISQLSIIPVSFIQIPPRPSLWVISTNCKFGPAFSTLPIGDKRTKSVHHLRLPFGVTYHSIVLFSLPKYFAFPYFHYLTSRPTSSSQSQKSSKNWLLTSTGLLPYGLVFNILIFKLIFSEILLSRATLCESVSFCSSIFN